MRNQMASQPVSNAIVVLGCPTSQVCVLMGDCAVLTHFGALMCVGLIVGDNSIKKTRGVTSDGDSGLKGDGLLVQSRGHNVSRACKGPACQRLQPPDSADHNK